MEITRLVVGELEANCYLLKSENELSIIDPGSNADLIVDHIDKSGAKLKYIVNTHHHEDHVSANDSIQKKCGGEILIHKAEKDFVDFKVDRFIDETETIDFGTTKLSVMHTPGHSPGSICLIVDNSIFTGDTLFLNGCGRVDLLGGSEKDLEDSLLRLSHVIKKGMTVFSGHGDCHVVDF